MSSSAAAPQRAPARIARPVPHFWPPEPDGGVPQGAVTIMARIRPGSLDSLRELLDEISRDEAGNAVVPFGQISTIHFARMVILEAAADGKGGVTAPALVFSSDYDGSLEGHLEELAEVAGVGLAQVFSHCEGYPASRQEAHLLKYLRDHAVPIPTAYAATRGKYVGQILRENDLREAIQSFLDGTSAGRPGGDEDAGQIRADVLRFVRGRQDLRWALEPPVSPRAVRLKRYASLLPILALLPLGAVWALLLRPLEKTDPASNGEDDSDHVQQLTDHEDHPDSVQNQLTHLVNIKPGRLRLATLRFVLWGINYLARHLFNQGTLGGISSIHFARWIVIDRGTRLLFFSNFDGSWENYLGEFIDKAADGLTAIWSNTEGFPSTRFLILDGARDEMRFKVWTRDHQIPTQVWYSAYPQLTVDNILRNSAIRKGLSGGLDEQATRDWARLL